MFKKYATKYTVFLVLLTVALLVAAVFTGYIHSRAENIGEAAGETGGTLVGKATGSFRGYFEGSKEGEKQGKEAGLTAEDTTVNIQDSMREVGKLEALAAGISLKNVNKFGEKYTGLYAIKGDAVFSVDLEEAKVELSPDNKQVYIIIPEPELEVYLNQNSTEKIAEIQNFTWGNDVEAGLTAHLNSMTQTVSKVKEKMVNYDELLSEAKESALKQVRQLAEAVCGSDYVVYVEFK